MKYTLLFLIAFCNLSFGQEKRMQPIKLTGYGELYYSYDFSNPGNHEKSGFLYNHKRHNEINANLLMVKANYDDNLLRANIGLMAGNYAHYNLIEEPTWAQFIYEANVGVKLSKSKNIWLDAGIMPSHLGFESAISSDCWTLTRSLLAENSPYYEAGVKLSYLTPSEKMNLSLLLLNGWQRIQKPDDMQYPSLGMQFNYKPTPKLLFNYSNFMGSAKPDTLQSFRHFHNFYAQYEVTDKFGIQLGWDIGFEKNKGNQLNLWYSPVVIVRHRFNKRMLTALRGEYYHDPNQVIIATKTNNGFQTFGLSTNLDYDLNAKLKFRLEGKTYHSKDNLFDNVTKKTNYSITTNMSIKI